MMDYDSLSTQFDRVGQGGEAGHDFVEGDAKRGGVKEHLRLAPHRRGMEGTYHRGIYWCLDPASNLPQALLHPPREHVRGCESREMVRNGIIRHRCHSTGLANTTAKGLPEPLGLLDECLGSHQDTGMSKR